MSNNQIMKKVVGLEQEIIRLKELNREMLAVLKSTDIAFSCIRVLKGEDIFKAVAEQVRSIIAKAEGES